MIENSRRKNKISLNHLIHIFTGSSIPTLFPKEINRKNWGWREEERAKSLRREAEGEDRTVGKRRRKEQKLIISLFS